MAIVLVPVDGSESARRAVLRAGEIAKEAGSSVVVLYVTPSTFERDVVSQLDPTSDDAEQAFARTIVEDALGRLREMGVTASSDVRLGVPGRVVLDQIAELAPSAVVMGRRSQDTLFPEGSLSARVQETGVRVEVVA